MKSKTQQVQDIITNCFFDDGAKIINEITVEGITATFKFDPKKIEANRAAIITIINEMDDKFFESTGGGGSFLNLCLDKNGHQWGEHVDCDALIILAMAIGRCRYCLPREIWGGLPGGMPYVVFKDKNKP